MRKRLAKAILQALNAAEDRPLGENALLDAVAESARADQPTDADTLDALNYCQALRWVSGVTDALSGRTWTLTEAGKHVARRMA